MTIEEQPIFRTPLSLLLLNMLFKYKMKSCLFCFIIVIVFLKSLYSFFFMLYYANLSGWSTLQAWWTIAIVMRTVLFLRAIFNWNNFQTYQFKSLKPIYKNWKQKYRKARDRLGSEDRKNKNLEFILNGYRSKKLQV